MKNVGFTILVAFLMIFAIGVLNNADAARPSTQNRIGTIYNNNIYSNSIGPVQTYVVTGGVSGQTQFACSDLAGDYPNDALNLSWVVYVQTATNIAQGTVVDITDFVSSTGTVTTAAAGANWALNDEIYILFGIMGTGLEGGGSFQTAVVTSALAGGTSTDPDTIYCESLIGQEDDLYNDYILEVTLASAAVPEGERREIINFVGATGELIYEETTAAIAAGDIVSLIHKSQVEDATRTREMTYLGLPLLDVLPFAELITYTNVEEDLVGQFMTVTFADNSAPQGEMREIIEFSATAGTLTLSTALTVELTSGDKVVVGPNPILQTIWGSGGIQVYPSAAQYANGVGIAAVVAMNQNLGDTTVASSNYVRSHIDDMESDADTTELTLQSMWSILDTEFPAMVSIVDSADVAAEYIRSHIDDMESDADTTELTVQQIMGLIDTEIPALQTDLDELTDEWRTIVVYVNHVLADSVWSSVATHEVFTFPLGAEVEFELTVQDSIALQGGDSLLVMLGANKIMSLLKNDWDAGEYAQCNLTPANFIAGAYNVYNPAIASCGVWGDGTGGVSFKGMSKGIDLGYEVQTGTIVNAGYSIWTLRYLVRNGTGVVTAGAGGTL